MKGVNRVLSYFVVFCVFMQACLLISCGGGGGGGGALTTAKVSREIARANTQPQIHKAYDDAITISGLNGPVGGGTTAVYNVPANVQEAYEELQANEPASAYPTISQMYAVINNDPDFASGKLGLTDAQLVADLNSKLAAAYASPNSPPSNATLVLLSSTPGNIPSVAPTLTPDTKLSPLQRMMFGKYLGTLAATRSLCTVGCYAAYYAILAIIAAAQADCTVDTGFIGTLACRALAGIARAAAKDLLNQCLAGCHDQGNIVLATH